MVAGTVEYSDYDDVDAVFVGCFDAVYNRVTGRVAAGCFYGTFDAPQVEVPANQLRAYENRYAAFNPDDDDGTLFLSQNDVRALLFARVSAQLPGACSDAGCR